MLTEEGTRTAILTTIGHKHFKLLPRGALKTCTPKRALPHSKAQPQGPSQKSNPSAQRGGAGTDSEPAWAQVTPGPVLVTPRALALPEPPQELDSTPVRSREPLQAPQVGPLALNRTRCTAVQQGKGRLPSEPCSLHSTSGLLVFS